MLRTPALTVAVICIAGLSACSSTPKPALSSWDAVTAAPDGHRVLLENESVRVLRVSIPPGGLEPIHEHSWPSVMYFEQPQPITYLVYELVNGQPVERERIEAPALPAGHAEYIGPEGLHAVENRGSEPFVALRVELKDGAEAGK